MLLWNIILVLFRMFKDLDVLYIGHIFGLLVQILSPSVRTRERIS